jgi:hypothetical protein
MRFVTVAEVLLEVFHFARYHTELGGRHILLVCLVGSNYEPIAMNVEQCVEAIAGPCQLVARA